jgi:hypothetical protein
MSKSEIIFVTIGVWLICIILAAFYYVTSIPANLSFIGLEDKLAIFAFFRFPFWLVGLFAIVSFEIAVLKPFYEKLNSSFVIGVVFGLIFYFVMTDYLDKSTHTVCSHCVERFGFPFHYIETENYTGTPAGILWFGLIGNILIALIFSFIIGLISSFKTKLPDSRV